nr:hypothetical protein [Mycobacterium sp. QGD 101]
MEEPFIGSEALKAGVLTRHELRTRFVAVHHDVYVTKGTRPTAVLRAKACWLRSRRRGVLAGFSASALHGARWIDSRVPAYIIDSNRRSARGPTRTAVDLACKLPEDDALAAIDALARAARLKVADIAVAAEQHRSRRGIKQARASIALVDPGAVIRVTARDTEGGVLSRVARAWASRAEEPRPRPLPPKTQGP